MSYKPQFIMIDCITGRNFSDRINTNSSICIINCKFNSIKSFSLDGGAILINITSIIKDSNIFQDCLFTDCYGLNGGSIYISSKQQTNFSFINCNFDRNSAETDGGSIYIDQINSEFFNCSFTLNTAAQITTKNGKGGSIYIINSKGTIENCTFLFNSVLSSTAAAGQGGALFQRSSNQNITNCYFEGNYMIGVSKSAQGSGGAVYSYISNGTFFNCTFKNNSAISNSSSVLFNYGYGAAIYMEYSSKTITNCFFTENRVVNATKGHGGAVFVSMKSASFTNCTFERNLIEVSNEAWGGAAYLSSASSLFESCNFIDNKASVTEDKILSCGGFVYIASCNVFLDLCLFLNNKAERGGSIYYQIGTESYISISNSSIEHDCGDDDMNVSSIVFFYHKESNRIIHDFLNNSVVLRYFKNIVVFDASISTGIHFKWNFTGNCLFPYKEEVFKTPNINMFDPSGSGMISLSYAFKYQCSLHSSSFEFTHSNAFSPSNSNSFSDSFTESNLYSNSETPSDNPTDADYTDSSYHSLDYPSESSPILTSASPLQSFESTFNTETQDLSISKESSYIPPSDDSGSSSKKSKTLVIVLIIIGIAFVIILVIIIFIIVRKRSSSQSYVEISQSTLLDYKF